MVRRPTVETTQQTLTQQVIEQHDKFLCNAYGRYPRAFIHGQGCELFDAEGKRYLDLFAAGHRLGQRLHRS